MCFPVADHRKLVKVLREEVVTKYPHYILYNDNRPFPHYSEYLADTRIMSNRLYPIKIDLVKVKSIPNTTEAIQDRKSTRLNSSNARTSYPVFSLKKKKK